VRNARVNPQTRRTTHARRHYLSSVFTVYIVTTDSLGA
jgi:hypothetical protein